MIYEIKNNNLLICNEEFNIDKHNIILVTDSENFSHLTDKYDVLKTDVKNKSYCCTQLESHNNYMYFTFAIPSKLSGSKKNIFDFILYKNRVVIIDDNNFVEKVMEGLFDNGVRRKYNLGIFFYELLSLLISKDLIFLEGIEGKLDNIEEKIISGNYDKFNNRLSEIKKYLRVYYRHYSQLIMACDGIFETENEFFDKECIKLFSLLTNRLERLKAETELLREYALQIQDMYQSEIEVRQNDIMKMLTIVTTIVLPLSLIAGWYGMNFKFMPELNAKYGYAVIILISVIVVIGSIILCKKKKYF